MAATQVDPARPRTATGSTLYLAEISTPVEDALLREWTQRQRSAGVQLRRLPDPSHAADPDLDALAKQLDADPDRLVVPVHVAWLPAEHDGKRRARLVDLAIGRNPYQPTERQQRHIARRHPERAQVLAGDPATVDELRTRWRDTAHDGSGDGDGRDFARYVTRRAVLALERADHRLLGPQYKTPRLVKEEILSSTRFRAGLQQLDSRREGSSTLADAGRMLDELATGWSRLFADIIPVAGRLVFKRGFDPQIDYDSGQVERLRTALRRHPAVVLWSHRSNLDSLVLTAAMRENGMPPAHLFGGINMAFGPMGPLMRRAGVIFIRRSVGDDPLYKYVLREYVGYLVEKRFNLSWSIEGTRSRTGKMLPPKLGLLSYVADAYLDGRSDDISLQPVSISFDQLHEIGEYAAYASGAEKKPEGLGWLVGFIRAQGTRHFGKIYVRFPEPVSMRQFLGPPDGQRATDSPARRLALHKMAFEVAWRTNQATPINAPALVTTVLLAVRGVALTLDQVHRALADALAYLEQRRIPTTASVAGLHSSDGVRATLDALSARGGPVTHLASGREPVWSIDADHQLAAAFYRNSLIHAFLDSAIGELALAHVADERVDSATDPLEAFWRQALRLRDLLKFEFYFEDKEQFRDRLAAELSRHDPDWQQRVTAGREQILGLLLEIRPLNAPTGLRPFFEAYSIIADVLTDEGAKIDEKAVVRRALGVGRQYVAQRRIGSREPVSALLFGTGLQLAGNQGLLAGAPDLGERRRAFLVELRAVLRRLDEIEQIATRRFWSDVATR
ncbi:MAG TPA: glycerol-3-phosphate 1-O-acyltransferase [Pseudonocardiaceae bacterium]